MTSDDDCQSEVVKRKETKGAKWRVDWRLVVCGTPLDASFGQFLVGFSLALLIMRYLWAWMFIISDRHDGRPVDPENLPRWDFANVYLLVNAGVGLIVWQLEKWGIH